jgi:DNA-binding transcriptional regulator LsrR (DeoR family)
VETTMSPTKGPHELVTTGMIARQYYIDRMAKQRIGDLHGISRHKVARILRKARESGVVRIEVGSTAQAHIELGETLLR